MSFRDAGKRVFAARRGKGMTADGGLAAWAEQSRRHRAGDRGPGGMRFAFYHRHRMARQRQTHGQG